MVKETIRRISELQKLNAQKAAMKREERQKLYQTAMKNQQQELLNQKREQRDMYREDLRLRFQYLKRSWLVSNKPVTSHQKPTVRDNKDQQVSEQ